MISPFSKVNYVSSTFADQSSVVSFIEDNWGLGRLGGGAVDTTADSMTSMLDFSGRHAPKLFLKPSTGERIASQTGGGRGVGPGGPRHR